MAKKPSLDASSTLFPAEPIIKISTAAPALSDEDKVSLGLDLYNAAQAAYASRSILDENLKRFTALYECAIAQDSDNERWQDSANLCLPIIPSELDAMVSYLSAQVFVQRFIIVSGNTDEASAEAPSVERYYNAELVRKRGQTTWLNDLKTVLHLGLRDGTAVLEAVWRRTKRKRLTPVFEPVVDEATGLPQIGDDGEVVTSRRMVEQNVVEYNDVHLEPILLKDFYLVPSESESVDDAVSCFKIEWLIESRLNEMVEEDLLWPDAVEKALSYVQTGTTEVASDQQGDYDKTAGGQVDTALGQGSMASRFFKNRGPIKVQRHHSSAFDLNGDGIPEENVFWVHEDSQTLLGWCPYEYVVPERPFFSWCPFPRPGRFYGYSLVERLADLVAEINAIHNQRRDAGDLALSPPLIEKQGVEIQNKGMRWGPNARWVSEDPDAIKPLQLPPVPQSAFEEEQLLNTYVSKLTGQSVPTLGAQSSGRRSATEMRQQQAAASTRHLNVAMNFRYFCRNVFDFIHRLKLQYLPDNPTFNEGTQKYTVPRQVLAMDYRIEVSGASDPVDAASRRQEVMAAIGILSKFPDVMQHATRRHRLLKRFVESLDWADVDALIGTDQEAAEQEQQEQMMALAAAQQQAGGGQPGAPGKPGTPPPQHPQQPALGAHLTGGA